MHQRVDTHSISQINELETANSNLDSESYNCPFLSPRSPIHSHHNNCEDREDEKELSFRI